MKCSACGRNALFVTKKNKRPRADKEHDLCQRCFRDLTFSLQSGKNNGSSKKMEKL